MHFSNNSQLGTENEIGHVERANVRVTFVLDMKAGNDWADYSLYFK